VLEGTLHVQLDKHELVLEPGDSLYFDSSVPHSLKAMKDGPVKLIAVIV
jgi:mannose-6-phosphate isomerase-like protein (cupin superfamily)